MSAATRQAVTLAISNLVEAMILNREAQLVCNHPEKFSRETDVAARQAELDQALEDHERSIIEGQQL